MPALAYRLPGVGAFVLGQAQQALAAGLQVHHPEGGEEVEHGRNHCGLDDLHVRHVDGFGHDEGHGAHHRWHDLPAHAGGGFHAAGERRRVAEALHQRDGELAGRHHVGHARAVDRAHERRGDHRHLRWPAARVADGAHGEIGEQVDHPCLLQEGAEQDEEVDVGGGDVGRRAEDALGAERERAQDLVRAVAAVREHAGQVLAEQAVK